MNRQPDKTEVPQLQDIELVSDGWIKKYILTYRLPNGELYEYESVSRKGLSDYSQALKDNAEGKRPLADAVCIVPILPDDSLLLIREFRYPINTWCVAFPAGLIESGETLEQTVNRELFEETGYRVRTDLEGDAIISLPQSGFSSVGMAEENVQVIIAYVEKAGEAHPCGEEFIEHFCLKRDEVEGFLNTNKDMIGTRAQLLLEAICTCNIGTLLRRNSVAGDSGARAT